MAVTMTEQEQKKLEIASTIEAARLLLSHAAIELSVLSSLEDEEAFKLWERIVNAQSDLFWVATEIRSGVDVQVVETMSAGVSLLTEE